MQEIAGTTDQQINRNRKLRPAHLRDAIFQVSNDCEHVARLITTINDFALHRSREVVKRQVYALSRTALDNPRTPVRACRTNDVIQFFHDIYDETMCEIRTAFNETS